MPAVTADTLTLPRLDVPVSGPDGAAPRSRAVRSVTTAPEGYEGEGFPVRRAFAGVSLSDLDPFVHMDQMGEVDYAPYEPKGTDWHPHRGFETVTYILDGTFVHQDSHGGGGTISNGGTQWMTAGDGLLHIETPPEELVVSGGLFHGVQLWVNLPAASKRVPPAYQNLDAELVTLVSSPDGGALVRLIAGELGGHRGPGSTHTPIVVAHATLAPGAQAVVPWDPTFNALAYVLSGAGAVGDDRVPVQSGQLAVFGDGDTLTLTATGDQAMDVLLLGGEPIREPVVQYGPFVMNTKAEVQQAFEDFQRGLLGTVPADGIHPYRGRRG
jgi:redox-sensitive bicupin YhaK (pirin superfamily)